MVKYHPDTRFLTDYAAGSLPQSQALCVAAHLHYCPACRVKVGELTRLGSELFMAQEPLPVAGDSFDRLMARLDTAPAETPSRRESPRPSTRLPRAIHKLTNGDLDSLRWRRVGKSFRYSTIPMAPKGPGDEQRETSLLYISAGGNVPKHHHRGDEITVVLKGSFSDQEDHYHVGDYIVRTSGETHTPVASQDEDCLCLSTLDAPIVINNWFYRLLMPLFNRPTTG